MARPTKAAAVVSGTYRKDVIQSRIKNEDKLKGSDVKLKPPKYLSDSQKKIFRFIVKLLEPSGILGSLDIYVLTECSICIDRMQELESAMNNSGVIDPALVKTKDTYTRAFFRYCNELSLSPQSRAKLANLQLSQNEEENPLLKVLADDDDE